LEPSPWDEVGVSKLIPGSVVTGKVSRVAQFGAFVELEPGIEALAHASTFTPTGSQNWTSIVPAGMTAPFEIQSIDLAKKRIGVALVAQEERDDYTAHQDEASAKGIGSMADKLKDALKPKPDG